MKTLKGSDGRKLLICRGNSQSAPAYPDLHILSGNSQHLDYVLNRRGQVKDYGPDRQWNNLLYQGDTAFDAGVPPLVRVIRVVRGKGYRYPDIRHRFSWRGKSYVLEAQKTFTGKNFTCKEEASGELVLSFCDTFFKRKQIGEVVISSKVPSEDHTVLLAAWLSFWEWDGRRTLLTFGESYLVQDVTA